MGAGYDCAYFVGLYGDVQYRGLHSLNRVLGISIRRNRQNSIGKIWAPNKSPGLKVWLHLKSLRPKPRSLRHVRVIAGVVVATFPRRGCACYTMIVLQTYYSLLNYSIVYYTIRTLPYYVNANAHANSILVLIPILI